MELSTKCDKKHTLIEEIKRKGTWCQYKPLFENFDNWVENISNSIVSLSCEK